MSARYRLAVHRETSPGVHAALEFPGLPTVGQVVFDALAWLDDHAGRTRATWHGGVGHRATTHKVTGNCGCEPIGAHDETLLPSLDRGELVALLSWCEANTRLGDVVELLPEGGAR